MLDDLGVDVGDKEKGGEEGDATAGAHGDGGDVPRGLLVQAELGRTLVDDGEGADGAGDEEEERERCRRPTGAGFLRMWTTNLMSRKMVAAKPPEMAGAMPRPAKMAPRPLPSFQPHWTCDGADGGDTDTGDGGDERVGGRDVSRVPRAPHDPGGGGGERAGEGEHLDAGVAAEGGGGDDAVLDGVGRFGRRR